MDYVGVKGGLGVISDGRWGGSLKYVRVVRSLLGFGLFYSIKKIDKDVICFSLLCL